MKKIFTLVCAAVIAVSTMNAEVLLNEHFAQTTETLATNDNVMANPIAETGWTNVNLSGAGIYVSQETDLTYAGYKSATDETGSAWYKAVAKAAATPLSKSITINDGSVKSVFVAGILNVSSVGAYAQSSRDYIWALGKGTASLNNTSADRFLRLNMRLGDDETSFQLAVSKLNEATNFQPWTGDMKFNTNYLVVTEYRYVEGDKNDSVFLYINPGKDDFGKYTLTSKQDTLQSGVTQKGSISQADAPTFGSMMLISVSSVKPNMFIDELKVTTSWADLWEGGSTPQPETPTIIADQSFSFGNVNVNEAANKNLTIKGSNLKGAISIASNNAQLVVSAASVTKEAAEAEEGAAVSLTLTATAAGEGSAKITLSSEDATNKVINVTWNAVAPMPSAENIAAIASLTEGEPSVLATQPIVVGSIDGIWVLQDATGAFIYNEYGKCELAIGDKLEKVVIQRIAEEDYTRGFITAYAYDFPTKVSSGNAISPIETNIANMNDLGPAIIKLTEVEFTDLDKNEFAKGWFNIKQGDNTARIQVPENCDIIGEAIPAKADVVGQLVYTTGGIAISSSANLTNRVPRSATAIENIQSTGKAVKVVRNGQLIILRDGKEYNVLGAEK
ncbi:hypothetical protein IJ596_00955 [bacterium]|nr:hypothetical protein [bacterium]